MRKLIVAGIITFLAVIGWISYLRYDVQQFRKELSQEPSPKQQLNDIAVNSIDKDTDVPLADDVANTKQSQHENNSTSLPEREPEESGQSFETVPNLEPTSTPMSTGLSPEMQAIYSDFRILHDEYSMVSKKYIPLSKQMSENTKRYNNYGQEYQSVSGDIEKIDELEAEYDDLVAWLKVNTPIYQRLQAEVYRLNDEMKAFHISRGFSSSNEFDWEAYLAWRIEQQN